VRWIAALDLERWADRMGARTALSEVVSSLIRAASKDINSLRFATGDSAQLPGYDGRLTASGAGPFVPDGESVWEFGVSSDVIRKRMKIIDSEQTHLARSTRETRPSCLLLHDPGIPPR
jgi:hypothetical protein